jgi:hypothetical protein
MAQLLQRGAIISFQQLIELLIGMSHEGHCTMAARTRVTPTQITEHYNTAEFQSLYGDLLTALVLFGEANVSIPSYLTENIEAEVLVREGLLVFNDRDETSEFKKRIAKTYELAFGKCRKLELNPVTSPLVSWDTIIESSRRRRSVDEQIEAASDSEDYEFYLSELEHLLSPMKQGLGEIFDYYLTQNHIANELLYNNPTSQRYLENIKTIFPNTWEDEPDPGSRSEEGNLFEDMGLLQLSALELEKAKNGYDPQRPFSFEPYDLRSFDEHVERILRNPHSEVDLRRTLLNLSVKRNPKVYLRVLAFWHTYFEVLNMLLHSEATRSPLFIPKAAKVHLHCGSRDLAATKSMIQVYQIFLTQSGLLPVPKNLEDVLRLREDPHLNSLRRALKIWIDAYPELENDPKLLPEIKAEFSAATKVVARLDRLSKIGTLVAYVALPVEIAQYIKSGGVTGLALAPIGPAVETYRSLKLRKFGWVKFGK